MRRVYILGLFIVLGMTACKERYDADVESMDRTFLVMEGNLNAAADSTVIRLTRTWKLESSGGVKTENNAVVTVEGKDNTTRSLIGRANGYYVSANLGLIIGTEYRLRIRTAGGKEYLSDYVKARVTPPVDSLNWEPGDGDIVIYANTHDPAGSSRYYRWDFDETWHIRSNYYTSFIYQNGSVRPRIIPGEEVYDCWKYDTSKTILVANSKGLQDDIIYRAPLTRISLASEKLSVRYSMQVRQYALDKEAYNFFELMKKNTEQVGSIFAPQPSELSGNIRCINDPTEYILGYVTASTVAKKRFFVVVPRSEYRQDCEVKNVTLVPDSTDFYFGDGAYQPFDFNLAEQYYYSSFSRCVDCRVRGGSLTRPSYW